MPATHFHNYESDKYISVYYKSVGITLWKYKWSKQSHKAQRLIQDKKKKKGGANNTETRREAQTGKKWRSLCSIAEPCSAVQRVPWVKSRPPKITAKREAPISTPSALIQHMEHGEFCLYFKHFKGFLYTPHPTPQNRLKALEDGNYSNCTWKITGGHNSN